MATDYINTIHNIIHLSRRISIELALESFQFSKSVYLTARDHKEFKAAISFT